MPLVKDTFFYSLAHWSRGLVGFVVAPVTVTYFTPADYGYNRIIESYHLSRTFDPDDPEDITKAINDVFSESDRYEQVGRNALEAFKIFNWENESKKLLAVYRSLGKVRNQDA